MDMFIFVMKNLERILFSDVHHTVVYLFVQLHDVDFQMHFQLIHLFKEYFVTGSYCWQTLYT